MTARIARWFLDLSLDGGTTRWWNGEGDITFDGQTYIGLGKRFIPPKDIKRTASLKSEKLTLEFDCSGQLDNSDPIGALLDQNWRRRPIRLRMVVWDYGQSPDDGDVYEDERGIIHNLPSELQQGEQPILEMEIESGLLAYLERRKSNRTAVSQKAVYPDDEGFDLALKLRGTEIPWRTKHKKEGTLQKTWPEDDPAPRHLCLGEFKTAGSFVAHFTNGQQRKYLQEVRAVADHQLTELNKIWVNGELTVNQPLVHGQRKLFRIKNDKGENRFWVTYYDGRANQTANSYLVNAASQWTSNHRLRGVAYVILEHLWDQDIAQDFNYEFGGKGAKLWDRSKDSTAGGSGTHRLDDPSTWEYTTNNRIAIEHYRCGIRVNSSSDHMWFGVGEDVDAVPYAEFLEGKNHCDESVTLKAGGTQKRYEVNGVITSDTSHDKVLERLAENMCSDAIERGGRLAIWTPISRTPVMTLTDGDLVRGEPTGISPGERLPDMVNTVTGTFIDPANEFKSNDYPEVSVEAYVNADAGEIEESFDQDLETSGERAQRKAALRIEKSRRIVELDETFGLKARAVRPGDWYNRTSASRGFTNKVFEAVEVRRFQNGTVRITGLEVDPAQLVWDEERAKTVSAPPAYEQPTLDLVPVPSIAIAAFQRSNNGVVEPGFRFSQTLPADLIEILADRVEVEYGPRATGGGIEGNPIPKSFSARSAAVEFFGFEPSTEYAFRFRNLLNAPNGTRYGSWSNWQYATSTSTKKVPIAGTADEIPWGGVTDKPDLAGLDQAAADALAQAQQDIQAAENAIVQAEQNAASNLADAESRLDLADDQIQNAVNGVAGDLADAESRLDLADATLQDNIDGVSGTLTATRIALEGADTNIQQAVDQVAQDLAQAELSLGAADSQLQTALNGANDAINGAIGRLDGVEPIVEGHGSSILELYEATDNQAISIYRLAASSGAVPFAWYGYTKSDDSDWVAKNGTLSWDGDGVVLTSTAGGTGSSGTTDSTRLEVPSEIAASLYERKIKLRLLVEPFGGSPSASCRIAYSTNSVGNSGFVERALSGGKEWIELTYTLAASNGTNTDHVIGVNADASNSGKAIKVHEVEVLDAELSERVGQIEADYLEVEQVLIDLENGKTEVSVTDQLRIDHDDLDGEVYGINQRLVSVENNFVSATDFNALNIDLGELSGTVSGLSNTKADKTALEAESQRIDQVKASLSAESLVTKRTFEDGEVGDWTSATAGYPQVAALPAGNRYSHEMRISARDTDFGDWIYGQFRGRVARATVDAWNAMAFGASGYPLRIGFRATRTSDGVNVFPRATVRAAQEGWGSGPATVDIVLPDVDIHRVQPFIQIDGDGTAIAASGDHASIGFVDIKWLDEIAELEDTTAQHTQDISALVDADGAQVIAIEALEAELNRSGDGVLARIDTVEGVSADNESAIASFGRTLTAMAGGVVFGWKASVNEEDGWSANNGTITNYGSDKLIFTGDSDPGVSSGIIAANRIEIPIEIASNLAGKKVRIRIDARPRPTDATWTATTEFKAAYSTNSVGNSGWQTFSISGRDWFEFDYDVPETDEAHIHYLAVHADTSNSGRALEAYQIQILDYEVVAAVQILAAAISNPDYGAAIYQVLVQGSGSNPSLIQLLSGDDGSALRLVADIITLSNTGAGGQVVEALKALDGNVQVMNKLMIGADESFVFDPVNRLEIIDDGTNLKVRGLPFGAPGEKCVEWFGPSGTAISSITRTNGYWSQGLDGKIYKGDKELDELLSEGGLSLTIIGLPCQYIGLTGGTVTTNTVTYTATGGTGPYSFKVELLAASSTAPITIQNESSFDAASAHATNFSTNIPTSGEREAIAMVTVSDDAGNVKRISHRVRFNVNA